METLFPNDGEFLQLINSQILQIFLGNRRVGVLGSSNMLDRCGCESSQTSSSSLRRECISTRYCSSSLFSIWFYGNKKRAGIYSLDFNTSLCKCDHFSVFKSHRHADGFFYFSHAIVFIGLIYTHETLLSIHVWTDLFSCH